MPPLASLLASADSQALLIALLGDAVPADDAADALAHACREATGEALTRAEFLRPGVGLVLGARLADGRRIVAKAHLGRVEPEYLDAVRAVQERLSEQGFPAPRPIGERVRFGTGTLTVESLEDQGATIDGWDSSGRQLLTEGLAELVRLATPHAHLPGFRTPPLPVESSRPFPNPHDPQLDFTAPGAEWINDIACRAKPRRDAGAWVVGHLDWRAQHVRVADGRLSAVYDWDSLAVTREPIVAAQAAHAFPVDWSGNTPPRFPALDDALGFLADYETARGAPFSSDETRAAHAALVWMTAYTARCEHALAPADAAPPGSARAFLRGHAETLLT